MPDRRPIRSLCLTAAAAAVVALASGALSARQEPPPAAPRFELAQLAWLAGHWRAESEDALTEELWLPPRGGVMLGLNRSVRGTRKAGFEFVRLEQDERGVVYVASPSGGASTTFRMTALEGQRAVFENPAHDFPKRIEYRRDGATLVAATAGDRPGPSWTWTRVGEVD